MQWPFGYPLSLSTNLLLILFALMYVDCNDISHVDTFFSVKSSSLKQIRTESIQPDAYVQDVSRTVGA